MTMNPEGLKDSFLKYLEVLASHPANPKAPILRKEAHDLPPSSNLQIILFGTNDYPFGSCMAIPPPVLRGMARSWPLPKSTFT